MAARLGWGAWQVGKPGERGRWVEVRNSPFAAGHGPAGYPVCAAIRGVLRAIALVGYGEDSQVSELECAAQTGGPVCRFHIERRA